MANYTQITDLAISTCRTCGARIAWLRSQNGRPYCVNAPGTTMRVRRNDFHSCRQETAPRPSRTATAPQATTPAQLQQTQEQIVTAARQQYTSAFDSLLAAHLGLWLRNNGTENIADFTTLFSEMVMSNLEQRMNGILQNAAAARHEPAPTPAAINASLESVVAATERMAQYNAVSVEPDPASGPESGIGANGYNPSTDNVGYDDSNWPSDEDVPF